MANPPSGLVVTQRASALLKTHGVNHERYASIETPVVCRKLFFQLLRNSRHEQDRGRDRMW
jgi:hypothetical protein